MTILFPTIVSLALLDALNPFSIAALVYLLGAPRPITNGLLFTGGTYFTYLIGGLLFLAGWQSAIGFVAPLLPWWSLGAVELVAGVALVLVGIWLWTMVRSGTSFAPPQSMSWFAILAFAASSTFADLTSAIPYFGAANLLLLEGSLSYGDRALFLALYCLLYCGPLIVLIGARALFHHRSDAIFFTVRRAVDWAFAKLTAPVTTLAGAILVLDAARRLGFIPEVELLA